MRASATATAEPNPPSPVTSDCALAENDTVVFITRGEMPGQDELEALKGDLDRIYHNVG